MQLKINNAVLYRLYIPSSSYSLFLFLVFCQKWPVRLNSWIRYQCFWDVRLHHWVLLSSLFRKIQWSYLQGPKSQKRYFRHLDPWRRDLCNVLRSLEPNTQWWSITSQN